MSGCMSGTTSAGLAGGVVACPRDVFLDIAMDIILDIRLAKIRASR
jgi:hypothetical protein